MFTPVTEGAIYNEDKKDIKLLIIKSKAPEDTDDIVVNSYFIVKVFMHKRRKLQLAYNAWVNLNLFKIFYKITLEFIDVEILLLFPK